MAERPYGQKGQRASGIVRQKGQENCQRGLVDGKRRPLRARPKSQRGRRAAEPGRRAGEGLRRPDSQRPRGLADALRSMPPTTTGPNPPGPPGRLYGLKRYRESPAPKIQVNPLFLASQPHPQAAAPTRFKSRTQNAVPGEGSIKYRTPPGGYGLGPEGGGGGPVDDDEMKMTMRCYAEVCQATGARRQVPGVRCQNLLAYWWPACWMPCALLCLQLAKVMSFL